MRSIVFILLLISCSCFSQRQTFSVSADKNNVLYIGVDNPLTIAVENLSCGSIIVQTNNGKVAGKDCRYMYSGGEAGTANIAVFKKVNGEPKILGIWPFRVKELPLPVFKIGSGKDKVPKAEIANQEFVRAELENFDFDVRYTVDSFKVCIFSGDTCKYSIAKNNGSRISEEIHKQFEMLKPNDVLVFKDIYIKQPDGRINMIAPCIITIY